MLDYLWILAAMIVGYLIGRSRSADKAWYIPLHKRDKHASDMLIRLRAKVRNLKIEYARLHKSVKGWQARYWNEYSARRHAVRALKRVEKSLERGIDESKLRQQNEQYHGNLRYIRDRASGNRLGRADVYERRLDYIVSLCDHWEKYPGEPFDTSAYPDEPPTEPAGADRGA
jgi:hypothetical protein